MKVIREVIADLWPANVEGHAGADTHTLIDQGREPNSDFFSASPGDVSSPASATPAPCLNPRARPRCRTKWILRGENWMFLFARESS
jgi:hypothetical protein